MSKRSVALVVTGAVLFAVFTAVPASAAFSYSVSWNHQTDDFYSPFSGPAHVRFNYRGSDPDATFSIRLRLQGGATVHSENHTITTPTNGFKVVDFDWPAVSVTVDTNYQLEIWRGANRVFVRTFEIKPPLVRITSIKPDPFFPWINDDYRDTTEVTFKLAASVDPAIVQIYEANATGGCCGPRVRRKNLENEVVGTRQFVWNGRDGGADLLPKGKYFVTITVTKPSLPQDVTKTSKPVDVSIARFRRVTKTVSKNGIAYHHRSPSTVLAAGGACSLKKILAAKDLGIRCDDARFRVFWRWKLPGSAEIEGVSFVLVDVPGPCGATKGHTAIDTFLRVGGLGHFRCRIDKARLKYSFLKAS